MKTQNHLHKYKRVNIATRGGKPYYVFKCIKPTCNHYIPVNLSEGKLCECNRCGLPMLITKAVLSGSSGRSLSKPHCLDCVKRKKMPDVTAIAEFLSKTQT